MVNAAACSRPLHLSSATACNAVLSRHSARSPAATASLIAYIPELGTLDRRQIAALVGMAPYNCDSGTHAGKRRIHGGRPRIRRVLYMATWSAIRSQPDFKAHYQALRQRVKCAKVAVVACMRVLLIRINAMLRDKTEWKMAHA